MRAESGRLGILLSQFSSLKKEQALQEAKKAAKTKNLPVLIHEFRYSNLDVSPKVLHEGDADELIKVTFTVTNTGSRAGAEVAELYVGEKHPQVPRPTKELKGFQKVYVEPGESRTIAITLDGRSLAYYNVQAHAWEADRDVYDILVGSSSQDLRLHKTLVNLFTSLLSVLDSKPVPMQSED